MKPLKINGKEYELPSLEDLTLDECIIVERHAGKTIDKVELGKALDVGGLKGVIHVAVLRAEPGVSFEEISEALGKLKLTEIAGQWKPDEAGQSPPAEQPSTPSESSDSVEPSGDSGDLGGEPSPEPSAPPPTGNPGSEPGSSFDPAISEDSPLANLRAVGSS